MHRKISSLWPFFLICTVALLFFLKLFYPEPSLLVTPDYGRSDLTHSKIPTQMIMEKNLKNFSLPLWDKNVYKGYPVLEGLEMGFFYIPNLVLFSIFPFWLAFNLSYLFNAIFTGLGMYLFTRSFAVSKLPAVISALTFSFSPIFSLHFHHFNLILALATIPWLWWLVNSFFNTKKTIFLILIPIFISQQYLAGSPQIPTYNLLFIFSFFVFKLKKANLRKILRVKISVIFISVIFLGFLIASIQLIPTYKLSQTSNWFSSITPGAILTEFPFKLKNLLTMLDPYILGNPKYGTYPHWQVGKWGIFWESNAYFGILQLTLIIIGTVIILFKRKGENKSAYFFFLVLFLVGILLSLGSDGPLHPLFSIPPLSFFRVPSRFLFITFFSAAILTALSLERMDIFKKQKKLLAIITIFITLLVIIDIFRVWYGYNLTGQVKKWFSKPELAEEITSGRVISYKPFTYWNETFTQKGWANQEESYLFYRNFLGENLNVIFDISQFGGYESFIPNRIMFTQQLSFLDSKDENGKLEIGKISQKILDLSSVNYLTTPFEIQSENWRLIKSVLREEKKIFLYKNENALPYAFIVNDFKVSETRSGVLEALRNDNFNPKESAIMEKNFDLDTVKNGFSSDVQIISHEDETVILLANTNQKSILVLTDSFYEGWVATDNGRSTKIYPVNINSRGIFLEPGEHEIIYTYKPRIVSRSAYLSGLSLVIFFFILYKVKTKFKKIS